MAQIKTANFLPEAYRTTTNQKFLNATLDQLVTQPDLRNINGYVGRTFAPTFKSTDNYVPEPSSLRQDYQLEPSVVVTDPTTGDLEFFSSYIDLIQQVRYNSGLTSTNQTRQFSGEDYSYDGLFDFDKFINFNQYYWLENGPTAVEVFANGVPTQETFTVTRDTNTGTYRFSTMAGVENPTIQLAYGGSYTFIVNQPGFPFWIQTSAGTSGTQDAQTNLSNRNILGVTNNGADVGTITFNVPQPTAQNFYVNMSLAGTASLSTALSYTDVQKQPLSKIVANFENGFDGVNAINQINLNSLIFVNTDLDNSKWTESTFGTVPVALRRNAWQIVLSNDADPIVTLNPILQSFTIGALQKVYVASGVSRAQYTYYLANDYLTLNLFNQMPNITAPLSTLFYQDGITSSYVGQVSLLTSDSSLVDVETDILGAANYQSPNGVVFSNGLKITFDESASPSQYQNQTFYVEGVGESISLINVDQFVTPESFALNGLTSQDYITVNRASIDLNPWTRSNRWFHADVINASASYNNVTPILDQTLRATRPIIEFESNIQLYNFGRVAKAPIDLINFSITDCRNAVELQPSGFAITDTDPVTQLPVTTVLTQGMRIVFANDFDPTVKNLVYIVNIVYIQSSSSYVINLVPASDSVIETNNNVIVLNGAFQGIQYYFNGSEWVMGQQKTAINQSPMFDVVDANGISLGDTAVYTNSTFATTENNLGTVVGGTPIFSYGVGTGSNDPVLGFPLSYRTFNQIGDIQFTNNFDSDTIDYTNGAGTALTDVNINTLGWLQQNTSLSAYNIRNSWTTNTEQSKQFQIISGVYDGNNPYFQIDISADVEGTVPYFRVYLNAQQITGWESVTVGILNYVKITDSDLTTGDQIDILIYSNQEVSNLGYYEVPDNLNYNSENASFTSLTLGQLRNHVSVMVANSNQVTGSFPGNSNLRDLQIKAQGGNILQHASPVLYSELFLVDTNANFLNSIDLSRREYSRLKNKILELSVRTTGLDFTNIPALLDTLLQNINSAKNSTFAWYYSDMVPYGSIKTTISYTVQSPEITDYEISNIFSDVTLSNQAVLVYLNGSQLTKDQDYSFDTTRAGITITVALTAGDSIVIYEYTNTDGNFIPETPTKLGLFPKFVPTKYYDTTYITPIYVIQGHDGSITPAFGDFRDDLLLEFEKRIYNNIKINEANSELNIYDYLPGKFRTTDYSLNEFNQLLTNSFLLWVGNNKVDYITNSFYSSSNPFTWCYNKFSDLVTGQQLLGYWRGIYKYFYDTDRPHTNPWEMVGFSEQPTWWENRYGPAPYTSGNMVLWDDMSLGYVWNNGDSYTDERFVRPGLQNIIPVDYTGALVPPSQILVKSLNGAQTSGDFKLGDQGPVETAWRRSSDFPFAFNQALAMAKPAFYFGTLMNVNQYFKNTELNQYIESNSLQRIDPSSLVVNGTTSGTSTTITRGAGYVNWIRDYLQNLGINPGTYLQSYLQNVNIQLAYKMAGYTDQSFIQVIAEQSSPNSTNSGVVIPNESYSIELYKSTPVTSATYSAVVVERTPTGFTVSGYDTTAPYFTIIPSLVSGSSYQIPVLNDVAVIYEKYQKYKVNIPYGYEFATRQQVVDFLVSYQRYLQGVGFTFIDQDPNLGVQRDWILSAKEFLTWAQQGWGATSILVLSPVLNHVSLYTTTGVIDKIQNSPTQSCILDTSYNFVKYSQFSVNRSSSVNGNLFDITANSGQTIGLVRLDVVEYEHVIIFDNVDIFNDVIYVPELGNRQYRLKLVGKKTGSWTGDLNPAGFMFNNVTIDAWQTGTDYLMGSLVSYKSSYYTALNDIPATTTFDPTKWSKLTNNQIQTGLLPNFSYNAEKFNRFNDVDNPEILGDFHLYSDSAIGFQPRQYMTDFGLNEVTQAKFYQGYIRQKGTMNAINAFNAVGVNGATSNINVYEEWAMRVGEYGALDNNRSVDLILTEGTFNGDPVTMTFLPNGGSVSANSVIGVYPTQLYKTEGTYDPSIYLNRGPYSVYSNDIQTAGYVDLPDADITSFNISNVAVLSANISSMQVGTTVWTAIDPTGNWNIYRVSETDSSVVTVTYSVDNIGVVTTSSNHGRSNGDFIVINGFDDRVDGVYYVYNVISQTSFSVVFQGQAAIQIQNAISITGSGPLYYLQSVRIKSATDLNSITPMNGWVNGDKLWVDTDFETDGWAVYNKSTPWSGNTSIFNANMKLSANSYVTNAGYGDVVALSSSGAFAVASSQYLSDGGNVYAFVSNISNGDTYTLVANIGAHSGGTRFGASLDTAGNLTYIGNPGDGATQYGRVHIHQFDGNASFNWIQTLTSPSLSNVGDLYGSSVSASADGVWLYVSAPNSGNVYVYQGNATSYYTYANTISVSSSASAQFGYTLNTTSTGNQVAIAAPQQAVNGVSGAGVVYVFDRSIESFSGNGTTYTTTHPISSSSRVTVNGNIVTTGFTAVSNTLTFTNAPVIGSIITVETNYFQLLETIDNPVPTSGAAFGTSTWISGNDADVFVSSPGYSTPGYYSGIVYRFVNQGASYGTITGTTFNGVVNLGDSIRINGVNVGFIAGNTVTAAQNINSANITGVTAIAQSYGALTITSNISTPYQRLIIGPGNGNAMANLGLSVFANVQAILHPTNADVSEFGASVLSSPDSSSLVITASQGNAYNPVTFDADTTEFDSGSTIFYDGIVGSGAVFVYGLVNGSFTTPGAQDQYVLVETLENSSLSTNDSFGSSISMNGNTMLVGAPGDSNSTTFDPVSGVITPIVNGGTFYIYNNFSGNVGWDIVKQEEPTVDIDSISRIYLYNVNTQVISTNLDYLDPAKGKILGAAAEDLDYITAYDPAIYNITGGIDSTPPNASNSNNYWGPDQVTKTWWNTSVVRYVNYEQGNVEYRANNWGTTFPGSQIQVCEWVASSVPPSAYAGFGTPLYPDNSAYSVITTINPNSKLAQSTYYYWVTGKNSLEPESVHINTISTIQDIIANPQAQDIPYAAVVRDDSISLNGISTYLSGNSTVMHLDYDVLSNKNVIHSEYQLVQEGNPNSIIPTRIIDKLVDSLSGADVNGNQVPDSSLSPQASLGLGIAPNQTLFVNRLTALENWVQYVNSILIQYPIVNEYNINPLYDSAPLPDITTYDIQVASYEQVTYVDTSNITVGYTILVITDETQNDLWTTYEWNGTSWVLASVQSYYTPFYWSFADWYATGFDSSMLPTYVVNTATEIASLSLVPGNIINVLNNGNGEFAIYQVNSDGTTSIVGLQNGTIQLNSNLYTETVATSEIRILFEAIQQNIFIDTLAVYFNEMFFFLVNYILTEQQSVDWVFKTSFIGIIHYFKTLGQPAAYMPDDQTYYEDYINEVQPYRTSIREYLLEYQGTDEYYGDTTDFDIPATYITNLAAYSSPSIANIQNAADPNWNYLTTLPQYSMWANNYSYSINDVLVSSPGANYTLTPTVTVIGGGGTGANIQAIVNFSTGQIEDFEVINPGYGYTSQPTIFINGTGSGAAGYAQLVNHYQIDSLPTTTLYTQNNTVVYTGNIISQANTNAYGTVYTSSNGNEITLIDVNGTFNTTNYIFNDYANLNTTLSSVSNYTQFIDNSYNTIRTLSTTVKFDRISYSSSVIEWEPNITIQSASIVSFGGQAYRANQTVYSTAILTLTANVTANVGGYVTQAGTTANAQIISTNGNTITVGNLTTNFVRRGGNVLVNAVDTGTRPIVVNNVFDYTKYSILNNETFANATVWQPNIVVTSGEYVNYQGEIYQANANVYSSANLTITGNLANVSVSVGNYITQYGLTTANAQVVALYPSANIISVSNLTTNFDRCSGNIGGNISLGNIFVNGFDSNSKPVIVNNIFDGSKYAVVTPSKFENAADRITAYYNPDNNMPGKDLAQLMSGIEYPGVEVTGVTYSNNSSSVTSVFSSELIYTWANSRSIYSSNVSIPTVQVTISNSTVVYTGNIITQQNTGATGVVYATSTANVITLVDVVGTFTNSTLDYLTANSANLGVTVASTNAFSQISTQNLVDFTTFGYATGEPLTILNNGQQYLVNITDVSPWRIIVSGNIPTATLGSNVTLEYYDFNNPTFLDSTITNSYTTGVPTSTIDGGAYYDTYSSHAPEELVPGVTFDSLNLSVYTGMTGLAANVGLPLSANLIAQGYTSNVGYRIVQNMNGNAASTSTKVWPQYYGISASHITTLAANLNITDSNIYVTSVQTLTPPSVNTHTPGVVFINGEKIIFWGIDYTNNILSQIRRAADGTGAPLVHAIGSTVYDTNTTELIPSTTSANVHLTDWLNTPIGAPENLVFKIDNLGDTAQWDDLAGDSFETLGSAAGAVTDGTELQGSTTPQALFLKSLT